MSRTTAIVVTYESSDRVGATLAALREAHDRGLLDCIVVDNASRDSTADLVEREHPWVTCVALDENIGFGRACNRAFDELQTPSALLVNPDAEIPADAVARLLEFFDTHDRAGLAAPALEEPDGGLQHAGDLTTPRGLLRQALGMRDPTRRPITPGSAAFRTSWVCGAVLMIRTALLREVGGFDPRFFLYFEETDLCRRSLDAGYEIWAVPEAVGRHGNAGSARKENARMVDGCIAEHYYQSRFYYLTKHHGRLAAWTAETLELAILATRGLLARLRGRGADRLSVRIHSPIGSPPPEPR